MSLDVLIAGGTAWICSDVECGVHELQGDGAATETFAIELHDDANESGYHGVYVVGDVTASPPAAEPST